MFAYSTMKGRAREMKAESRFHWLTIITRIFITRLIVANIIAVKLVGIFGFIVPTAVIIFPISYIFGDILTEGLTPRPLDSILWA